jgi:hypothetical protein
MSATFAKSAAPSWKVTAWCDDRYVYIEIPSKMAHPFVEKFPLHEGGLSKALNFLRVRYEEVPSPQRNYTAPPIIPSTVNGKPPVQNEEQRATALNVLRKLGIV